MIKITLKPGTEEKLSSLGLLILRVGVFAQLACLHGWHKVHDFSSMVNQFPDPLGVSPHVSLALAAFAEFFCSILIVLGIWTRLAAIPVIITMCVALSAVHWNDPWSKKELAVSYLIPALAIFLMGPGKFRVGLLFGKK